VTVPRNHWLAWVAGCNPSPPQAIFEGGVMGGGGENTSGRGYYSSIIF